MRSTHHPLTPLVLAAALFAAPHVAMAQDHSGHDDDAPESLVRIVRDATQPFADVAVARDLGGYGAFLGCVSGPEAGAMGQHFVNGGLIGDNVIDATRPEALIYEPSNGRLRLVGVEFIAPAALWNSTHDSPPVLEGQSFHFVDAPNRFGIDAFYELHVWAWRNSPNGAFVDWNTAVRCGK